MVGSPCAALIVSTLTWRSRPSRRTTQLIGRAQPDADATYDPIDFSFLYGISTCARWRSTPRPAPRRCARVRRRHRHHRQPADRSLARSTAASPRHRAGAVRGCRVTTIRHLGVRPLRRLRRSTAADTINYVSEHTTSPSTTNTLGTKGVGEVGENIAFDARGRQRRRGCRAPPRRPRHRDAVYAPTGVEGHPVGRVLWWRAADEAQPHFADGAPNHDPAAGATDGAGQ